MRHLTSQPFEGDYQRDAERANNGEEQVFGHPIPPPVVEARE